MNSYIYQKPEAARYNLSRLLGTGVLVVEGDKHRQQVCLSLPEVLFLVTGFSAENNGIRRAFVIPCLFF